MDWKQSVQRATKRALARAGFQIQRTGPARSPELPFLDGALYGALSQMTRPISVVQIGANDGITYDPLRRFLSSTERSRALLVEPHPHSFNALSELYAENPRVSLANVAIGDRRGTMKLFVVADSTVERFELTGGSLATGVTSADKQHVSAHIIRRLDIPAEEAEGLVSSIEVPCIPLGALLEEYRFEGPDVLQVDAEGSDDIVIGGLDLERNKPAIINYEARHIPQGRYDLLTERLDAAGYTRVRSSWADECAVLLQ